MDSRAHVAYETAHPGPFTARPCESHDAHEVLDAAGSVIAVCASEWSHRVAPAIAAALNDIVDMAGVAEELQEAELNLEEVTEALADTRAADNERVEDLERRLHVAQNRIADLIQTLREVAADAELEARDAAAQKEAR